ncbi:WD40 repeat-like protein [Lactarius akahatsu]|uniref:WD40 repeat-like protein n=1 Tax=Lactarius akahatsu TaxID=416441 RepID=A0AAD4LPM6_9AGAM|nr:WD40 repeat-like protein [Lactarius akahatsu]
MRVRTLEIRWHDSKPISTCDFQPVFFKKARPSQDKAFAGQSYRLATGGEDNYVRIWMVYPNITPPSLVEAALSDAVNPPVPRPPRVEYLATLSRHSAPVNVVRFSPNGELIASAGDDGMIIIWAQSTSPSQAAYGSDLTADDMQFEKEHWKPRTTFRCTTMQVYDLAWSPTGEYIISGSTDNVARIFLVSEGKCVSEIAEHNHYVQGVAWDPLNEFIATQSSDRSMHVYSVSIKSGAFEVHAVGKNSRIAHHHTRTPSSHGRPRMSRRESTASDTESVITTLSEQIKEETLPSSVSGATQHQNVPLTPATSIASTPSQSMFPPPPMDKPSSRRSSFSGSNAPSSPALYARYARSPSPLPALPAIRSAIPSPATWNSVRLYGDEGFTNFFRRLTFSPDGGLLMTPAGQFEDPSVVPGASRSSSSGNRTEEAHGRKGHPDAANSNSGSSVYIYSRANFARPPVAQLPGHKKASVAVRFSPILYELRPGVFGPDVPTDTRHVVVEKGRDTAVNVDVGGSQASTPNTPALSASSEIPPMASPSKSALLAPLAVPAFTHGLPTSLTLLSPVLSATDSVRASSPAVSKPSTPAPPPSSGSVFALPYRMLFAVATMDTIAIHDTQQAGPICLLTKLHYDEFTDMSWSPDGQCLMLSSRDGYCTIVVFDEILTAHHVQQQTLQFQSIAHNHAVPLTSSSVLTPSTTPALSTISLPPSLSPRLSAKRPLTPAKSGVLESDVLPESESIASSAGEATAAADAPVDSDESDKVPAPVPEPPKKKRRVALTRIGDVGS